MWSCGVVVDPPGFDDPAGLGQAGEQMLVEAFVAQPAIEGLDEAVLRWLAGRDVQGFGPYLRQPVAHDLGGHLRTVV